MSMYVKKPLQYCKVISLQLNKFLKKSESSDYAINYCCSVASVVSDSVRPHRRQPTRLPRPWDSPGKNTGVGCHFLLQCRKVKSERELLSRVWCSATPSAYQAPPSMGFSRQEYWSGVPLPSSSFLNYYVPINVKPDFRPGLFDLNPIDLDY